MADPPNKPGSPDPSGKPPEEGSRGAGGAEGEQPPDAGAAPADDPDARPATVADLKGLRRWVIVAGIWAVAASAIGLIALLSDEEGSDEGRAQDNTRISRALGDLDRRMDRLESRVEDLPSSEDLERLQGRVGQAADRAASATRRAEGASEDISRANERIEELESQVQELESNGGGSGTTPDGGSP